MIYFVRHGESEANVQSVFAGQSNDAPLTDTGRVQAKRVASEIQSHGLTIDRIVTSPLARGLETAQIIAGEIGLSAERISTDARITEYDMGVLTGTLKKSLSSAELIAAEHAENVFSFRDRVNACYAELSQGDETVLIVSHAGVGKMLEAIRTQSDPRLFHDLPEYPNAELVTLD